MSAAYSGFELPIRCSVAPSKWIVALLYAGHAGAIFCVCLSAAPMALASFLCVIVLIDLIYWQRHYVRGLKRAPLQLELNMHDEWLLGDEKTGLAPATLLPEALTHPLLLVLRFKQDSGTRCVIITPDLIPEDVFRRLSVRVRFPSRKSD